MSTMKHKEVKTLRQTARNLKYHQRFSISKSKDGFTLIELLVVIAILIILAVAAWIVINPIELQRQGRDARRIQDLTTVNQAIQSAVSEATGSASYPLCNGVAGSCSGDSTVGGNAARLNNGTGWVKVNMSASSLKLPALPVDPINSGTNKYLYSTDGTDWELTAVLESTKYSPQMSQDGGDDAGHYEVGTNLSLIP